MLQVVYIQAIICFIFVISGDDRNIEEVYVAGKLVVPFSSSV